MRVAIFVLLGALLVSDGAEAQQKGVTLQSLIDQGFEVKGSMGSAVLPWPAYLILQKGRAVFGCILTKGTSDADLGSECIRLH